MTHTVLVIDDSSVVRMCAGRALKDAGFEVLEAVDGLDAMEKLETSSRAVSLILCDVNMPRMGGIDFVKWLALRPGHPPVVMLTTEGHPRQIQQAKESGAKGWMLKPVKADVLVSAARRLTSA